MGEREQGKRIKRNDYDEPGLQGALELKPLREKLLNSREGSPTFDQPKVTLEKLLGYGNMLVQEQENVETVQLAETYLKRGNTRKY